MDIDLISKEIVNAISNYSEAVTNATKRGIDKTAQEAKCIVEEKAPSGRKKRRYEKKNKMVSRRSGKYKESIQIKIAYEDRYNKREYVCVKPNEHALAHLLENGHAMRQGGRFKGNPHFIYGEKYIHENMEKNITKELNSIDTT